MKYYLLIVFWMAIAGFAQAEDGQHPCAMGQRIDGEFGAPSRGGGFRLLNRDQEFILGGLNGAIEMKPLFLKGDAAAARLTLFAADNVPDRYGRLAVQAFYGDQWVQGDLLRQGRVLAFGLGISATFGPDCLSAFRLAETEAEQSKRGLWQAAGPVLAAENLEALADRRGHFALVEGKVASVGDRARRLYLNFGQLWSQDFTVSVVKKGTGGFKGDIAALATLNGKKVRVRGLLEERQGPLIRLVDEAQIEILD